MKRSLPRAASISCALWMAAWFENRD